MKYSIERPIELRAIRGEWGLCEVYFLEYRIPPKNLKEKIFDGKWRKLYKYYYQGKDYDRYTPYDDWYEHWIPIFYGDSGFGRDFPDPVTMLEHYKRKYQIFNDVVKFNNEQSELKRKDIEGYAEYKLNHEKKYPDIIK